MADPSPPPPRRIPQGSLDGPSKTIVVEPVGKPIPQPATVEPDPERRPAEAPDQPVH